jgi:hypothetical protein
MLWRIRLLTAVVLLIGWTSPALALPPPEECTGWFPDFRCDREGRWEGFEMPIVQPYLFEDPFITTGATAYYLWHDFPSNSAFQGGDAHVAALQLRVALTDRLALIATKDGYMWTRPGNDLLPDENGWMNIGAGLKYALIQDRENDFILSGILRAEFTTGTSAVFAGGDGVLIMPSVSFAWGPLERLNLIGDLGGIIPTRGNEHSSQVFYHLYADYEVHPHFQPFVQLSGIYYVESGDGQRPVRLSNGATISLDTAQHALQTGHFEGSDALNLGSRGVDNNDYITWAIGTHVPITDHLTWSVAYERPLTSRKDITKQRVTTALRLEF